jgi:hypothetical protein
VFPPSNLAASDALFQDDIGIESLLAALMYGADEQRISVFDTAIYGVASLQRTDLGKLVLSMVSEMP